MLRGFGVPRKKKEEEMDPIEDIQMRIASQDPSKIGEMDFLPEAFIRGVSARPELEPMPELEESPSLGLLRQHLGKRPDRANFKQNTGQKILTTLAAALTGAASKDPVRGAEFGRSIKERPYNQAVEDWMLEGGKLKEMASLEESGALKREAIKQRGEDRDARVSDQQARLEQRKAELEQRISESQDRNKQRELDRELKKVMGELAASSRTSAREQKAVGDISKQEDAARAEYQKRTKIHDEFRTKISRAKALGKQAGSVAEIGQLMTFISSIDDTAAREGEVNTQRAARSVIERLSLWKERLSKNIAITPQMRKELNDALEGMFNSSEEDRKLIQEHYIDLSKRRGYNPQNIILEYEPSGGSEDDEINEWLKRNGIKVD